MERVARIELANKPWQGFRLPLHHTRMLSGGATETRTQKATLVTRRISNPLQYHYGTAPVNYLVGTLAYYKKNWLRVWESNPPNH